MKRLLVVLLVLIMAFSVSACGSGGAGDDAAEKIVIKAAHVEVEDRAIHQSLVKFGEYISAESDGVLQLEIYPNGELGDDSDVVESLVLGTVQITIPGSAVFTAYDEKFAVMNLPYLFDSKEQMDAAFTGEFGDMINEWFEEYGFVGLGFQYDGARCMSNNKRAIYSPKDMSGIKFRVMDSALYIDMFKMMGANPTPMGYGEVYTALQQGVIDGQDNPPGLTYGSKFNEVLDYYSVTQHVYANCPAIISADFFYGLDEEYQNIIREGAEMYLVEWQRAEESAMEEGYIKSIAEEGTEVNYLDADGIKAFQDSVIPLYESYRVKLGDDVMDKVMEYAKSK